MKVSRISALLVAGAFSLSLISCTDNNTLPSRISRIRDKDREYEIGQSYADKEDDPLNSSDIPDELCDTYNIQSMVQVLIDHINENEGEDTLREDIQSLLDFYDRLYEANTNMEIVFYSSYTDKEVEEEYNKYYRAVYVADDLLSYGFYYGYTYSEHKELFADLVDTDRVELYKGNTYNLKLIRLESELSFDEMSESLSNYYGIESSTDLSLNEKDLKCAEILLALIDGYDTDLLYSQYDRDYTGEEILTLSKTVKSELLPAFQKLMTAYLYKTDWAEHSSSYDASADPFEVIVEFAPLLSPDITESAELIYNEKLYTISDKEGSYVGAFTDNLPAQNKARIFIGNVGAEQELISAIHEFGHFHAALKDDTPSFLHRNNLDIAEIQSQGLELLFMQFYDDIYGSAGSSRKLETVVNMLDSVICGFLMGEFEYTVVRDREKLTPQDVVDLFNDTFKDYEPGYRLHYISHLFISPGYYISYATSALAAFDIFDDVLSDPHKALEQYEKMANISSNSGEYTFRKALSYCGFNDVLTKKYISELADELNDYAESF